MGGQPRIVVMGRLPEAGRCKTRLIPLLGAEGAAELQQKLLLRTLHMALDADLGPVALWLTGSGDHPLLAELAQSGAAIHWQQGHDLGARMAVAAQQALSESPAMILIGCDCPALDAAYLADALQWLQAGDEVVIGAADDGGYVLLAARVPVPRMFVGIDWGSSRVLAQTECRLSDAKLRYRLLPALMDVDTPEDYRRACDGGLL